MAFDKLQKLDPDLYNLIIYEGDYQEVNSDDVPDSDNSDNPPQSQDASDGSQQPQDTGMDTTGENAQDIQNEKNSHDTMDPNVQQSEDAQNQQAIWRIPHPYYRR